MRSLNEPKTWPWQLIRPGVRMMGQWGPDVFDYPFRYEVPKVGDKVFVILRDQDTREFRIEEDVIEEVADHWGHSLAVNDTGEWFVDPNTGEYALARDFGQAGTPEGYLIDFWISKYNVGHGLSFGDELFETREDAQEILDDILNNLDKWDGL